jgi:hypothetical protein
MSICRLPSVVRRQAGDFPDTMGASGVLPKHVGSAQVDTPRVRGDVAPDLTAPMRGRPRLDSRA